MAHLKLYIHLIGSIFSIMFPLLLTQIAANSLSELEVDTYTDNTVHEAASDFSTFPKWFQDHTDVGFYVLGWKSNHTYLVLSWIEPLNQSSCHFANISNYLWEITFIGETGDHHCQVMFHNNGLLKEFLIQEQNLPHPSCRDPSEVYPFVDVSIKSPGARIVSCQNQSIFERWYEFQSPVGCYNLYMKLVYRECKSVKTTMRKILSTCNVEIIKSKVSGLNSVMITTNSDGIVQLKSNRFVKTESCNLECEIDVGDSTDLTVTCPNGEQHYFTLNEDLRSKCLMIDVPYVRWLALTMCKISFHPWLIVILFIWCLTGHIFVSLLFDCTSTVMKKINNFVLTRTKLSDPELGLCRFCDSALTNIEEVKSHLKCKDGVCAFCASPVSIINLKQHCLTCKSMLRSINNTEALVKDVRKSVRLQRLILAFAASKLVCQSVRWIGALIILFTVFIPPISSAHESKLSTPMESIQASMVDELSIYTNKSQQALETLFECDAPNITYGLDLFEEIEQELKICGDECFQKEGECNCGNFKSLLTSNLDVISLEIRNTSTKELVNNLDQSSSRVKRSHSRHHHGHNSKQYLHNITLVDSTGHNNYNNHISTLKGKYHLYKVTTNKKTLANTSYYVELHQARTVMTNWGMLHVNSQFEPSMDQQNINLVWESYKTDQSNYYIKGTSSSILNVYKGSGITYTINHPKSKEKLKVNSYIHDFSQIYNTKLLYVTSDRKLTTWFRGACTGDCPTSCSCSQNTCTSKKWDYDRNLGCNPTWCWSTNSGCSCCAADISDKAINWLVAVYEINYVGTELVFCNQAGFDKFNCKVTSNNMALNIDEFKFTISKVYGVDSKLPNRLAVFWNIKDKSKIKFAFPDGVWLNPDICDSNCNHGVAGDFKMESMSDFTNVSDTGDHSIMQWQGVDIEHTCHFGSWPDCEFYNLKATISDQFEFINRTSEHINEHFLVQKLMVSDESQLMLKVRPKSNGGLVNLGLQVKNYALKREETVPIIGLFKIGDCKGCYACSKGFTCSMTIKLRSPNRYNLHLHSPQSHFTLSEQTYLISSKPEKLQKFIVNGFTMLNVSTITICISEVDNQCNTADLHLTEPAGLMVENHKGSVTKLMNTDACDGISGFITCTSKSVRLFTNSVTGSIANMFHDWVNLLKMIILGLTISTLTYILVKIFSVKRSVLTQSKRLDPDELYNKLKSNKAK